MQVGRRRGGIRNGVVAGSVWESRMKLDEVKGGIKVFRGGEAKEEGPSRRQLKRNQSDGAVEKRRRWKPDIDKIQMQLRKTRSDCRRVTNATDKELGVGRGKTLKRSSSNGCSGKSSKVVVDDADDEEEEADDLEEDEEEEEIEKESFEIKEMNVAEEKPGKTEREEKTPPLPPIPKLASSASEDQQQQDPPAVEILPQISEQPISADDDQKPVAQPVPEQLPQISKLPISAEEDQKQSAPPLVEHRPQVSKSIPLSANDDKKQVPHSEIERLPSIPKVPITVKEDRKPRPPSFIHERLPPTPKLPICANKIRKSLPPSAMEHPSVDPDLKRIPSMSVAEEIFRTAPATDTPNRMQNVVNLVMWRDISKSALVFGVGTFILISSSFAKDLNFSFISAISYMSLFYLALVFFYKSILLRGAVDCDESCQKYIVGEEEAIWVAKMILPYLNELLLKLRNIFSGDPATTMKLAILLFVLARCGSSITIWTMAKMAFFGVFTVPKLCSTYSTQLTAYVKFWVGRFRDAWDSCTHKKAVAAAIFTVIWNLSSVAARIWAVFLLVVAVKYYQQSLFRDNWASAPMDEEPHGGPAPTQRHRRVPTVMEFAKEKKGS